MRRLDVAVLGLIGLGLAPAVQAQTAPANSTEAIIETFRDAPAGDDDDFVPLGDPERTFTLGLKKKPAAATAARSTAVARPVAARAPAARPAAGRAVAARPAPRPAYATPTLDMRVTFELGSATLTEQARVEARAFAGALKSPQLAGKRFVVAGHTDAIGSAAFNRDLSRRRAQAVVDFLVAEGADRSMLTPSGYGSDHPRPGTTASDPSNRRVEFTRAG